MATNPESDKLPDPCPQLNPPGRKTQRWEIGPAIVLGPNPNHGLGFKAYIPKAWPQVLQIVET